MVHVQEEEGGQRGGGVTRVGALDAGWNAESVCQVWSGCGDWVLGYPGQGGD